MSYRVFLDGLLMPITPSRITVRHKGRNQRTALIDGGELTHLRKGDGAELSLSLCLPRQVYPFARYERGFIPPEVFLDRLLSLREDKRPFRFICARFAPSGRLLTDTNLRVSLEDLQIVENAEDGDDVTIAVTLREYQEFSTTKVAEEGQRIVIEGPGRETDNSPKGGTHTVVRGDTLWGIARKHLGDGSRYREIFERNRDQIQNPNLIFPGQVLRLP